jgi:hypothetical protein
MSELEILQAYTERLRDWFKFDTGNWFSVEDKEGMIEDALLSCGVPESDWDALSCVAEDFASAYNY